MKRFYPLLLLSFFTFSVLTSTDLDDNGKAGYTGSPGEVTCNSSGCHTGTTTNTGGGSLNIDIPGMTNWQYVPGQTYTINATVSETGRSLFGLGFEILKSNGDNAGTLAAGTGNQIKTKSVSGFTRKNIVHTLNGGSSSNSHTFTFTWTAPATDVGDVTIYFAGNATNSNQDESGDHIYTTSQVLSVAPVGVAEVLDLINLNVYPNPFVNNIRVDYSLQTSGWLKADLYDVNGRLIRNLANSNQAAGNHSISEDLSDLSNGQYVLHMSLNGRVISTEIIQK
jgi:hypothetical protein